MYVWDEIQWDENYIYLIMEYCGGGDLSGFIQQRRILPQNVAKLLLQQLGIYALLGHTLSVIKLLLLLNCFCMH